VTFQQCGRRIGLHRAHQFDHLEMLVSGVQQDRMLRHRPQPLPPVARPQRRDDLSDLVGPGQTDQQDVETPVSGYVGRHVPGLCCGDGALGELSAAGADGVVATPPPYAHPTQRELVEHYRAINGAIDLPLIVYNWPRGTAVEISVEATVQLAELDKVVSIKQSTTRPGAVLDVIEAVGSQLRMFATLISPRGLAVLRALGGDGFIDGGGVAATLGITFFEKLRDGDINGDHTAAEQFSTFTSGWV
jgi:hypothetical protein